MRTLPISLLSNRFTLLLLSALWLAGCEILVVDEREDEIDYGAIEDIRYTAHVQPLLEAKCTSCHGGTRAEAGLRLDGWEHLTAGSHFGEVVIPFDAGRSLLVEMITKLRGGPHPREAGGDTLTQAEVAFLARWIEEGARNDAGEVPYEDADQLLYVCSQDAALVSVVDMETNLVIRNVDLQEHGFSADARPHHVAVEPDGSYWYVSLIGDSKVAKFDRSNRLVAVATIETPGMLAVHPARDLLVAGRSMTAVNPPASLGFLRRTDLHVDEVPVVFPRPHALLFSPDGRYVYTASVSQNEVITVDVETQDVTFTSLGGGMAQSLVQFGLAPDGRTLYLSAEMTGQLHVFDLTDPARPALRQSIDVGSRPWDPIVSPDGRFVYVGVKGADAVAIVDAEAGTVVQHLGGHGIAEPHAAILSPDGRFLYVSNNNLRGTYTPRHDLGDNHGTSPDDPDHHKTHAAGRPIGTVAVIDTATRSIVRVLEVEAYATGMGRAE